MFKFLQLFFHCNLFLKIGGFQLIVKQFDGNMINVKRFTPFNFIVEFY